MGITGKFSLCFTLMLALMLLIAATGYFSLRYIGQAEQGIRKSTEIEQLVLEMDRGLELARRLHGNFFLHYQHLGLQAAHEEYAQPSVREIAKVIVLSHRLKKMLFPSESGQFSGIHQPDVNLYLSSAQRFAETSIEAVELISRRAAPERGVETQLQHVFRTLEYELKPFPKVWSALTEAKSSYKNYLLSRQRYLMQISLNTVHDLHSTVASTAALTGEKKALIVELLDRYRQLAASLLAIDLAISGKLRDFSLQEQIVSPLSKNLLEQSRMEAELAEHQIDRVLGVAGFIILAISLLAAVALLFIARLMHRAVTQNVLSLTAAAGEFSRGRLDVRIEVNSQDELGQLGDIFNSMAARLEDLVVNLENKVEQRTMQLSASEQRFRNLVNDLPKTAVQGYARDRRVVYWNRASERLYGYPREEAMGRKLEELIIPGPMREGVIRAVDNWYDRDIAIPAAELTLRNKDGQEVPVYSSHVMLTSYLGEKTMYSVDIDLADLRLAQEAGRKIENFYRQLFAHSSSGVAVYEAIDDGQDFIFKDLNTAGEEIERLSRNEVIGKRLTQVFPGIRDFGLLEVLRRVWQTGDSDKHQDSFYRNDRIEGWRENRVYKLPSGEIVAVYDDITGQKQSQWEKQAMEAQLQRAQKMEAIGLLAGGVAHDLNNILSAVVGYPELLLLDMPADSALRQPLQAIKAAGERATAVVADLLTVARGIASIKEPRDLNVLVREYLESPEFFNLQAHHPEVRFEQELAATLPAISCSPVHVKKSVMNLVTNGAEAIDTSGTVSLATKSHLPEPKWAQEHGLTPGEYVVLMVTDTGSGIQPKDLEHIFEPFYTKKVMGKQSGTGLGLSVVWNTMQDHHGAVIVTGGDGTTTFALYFPVTAETIVAAGKRARERVMQGNGEMILVVDDEPQQRDLAGSMLKILGYRVSCQDSGEKALAYLRDHRVELVVIDMLMDPGMNGRQTYEQMIQIQPGQKAIIASGYSESDEVKHTLAMGAGGFIQKPYSIEQLGQAIKGALNG